MSIGRRGCRPLRAASTPLRQSFGCHASRDQLRPTCAEGAQEDRDDRNTSCGIGERRGDRGDHAAVAGNQRDVESNVPSSVSATIRRPPPARALRNPADGRSCAAGLCAGRHRQFFSGMPRRRPRGSGRGRAPGRRSGRARARLGGAAGAPPRAARRPPLRTAPRRSAGLLPPSGRRPRDGLDPRRRWAGRGRDRTRWPVGSPPAATASAIHPNGRRLKSMAPSRFSPSLSSSSLKMPLHPINLSSSSICSTSGPRGATVPAAAALPICAGNVRWYRASVSPSSRPSTRTAPHETRVAPGRVALDRQR